MQEQNPLVNAQTRAESRPRRGLVRRIYWDNLLCIAVLHAGATAALWRFSWSGLAWCVVLWQFLGGLGVCMGYHRLLTHRSFKTFKPVEYALTILGTMSWEAGPIRWVGQHRMHHAEPDGPSDPHTPRQGLAWSHLFWTFWEDPPGIEYRAFARDLGRDPIHRFIDRYHRLFNIFPVLALAGFGSACHAETLSWVLWGGCVRGVLILHATWLVNSAGHTLGYRNYETADNSRNNPVVALLTFGEGWHNNHHACERSARHGVRWFEVDFTYYTILLLRRFHLAWDVQGFHY